MAEKETVYVLCENGTVMPHDLPLPSGVADRVARKQLRLVNEDGSELSEPPAVTSDEVPTGTVAVVLAWVGEDRDRATRALEVENSSEKPRKGLVTALEALATEPE